MVDALFADERTWDLCLVVVVSKPSMLLDKEVKVTRVGDDVLRFDSVVNHPAPQNPKQAHVLYNMESYVKISEIAAVDYYSEKPDIAIVPGNENTDKEIKKTNLVKA